MVPLPWVLLVALVVVGNGVYLLGVADPNPMGAYTGLGHVLKPGLLVGSPGIDPNLGFSSQALGHRAALDVLHGHLPWWNPFEGIGTPLVGEMQGAPLFPLTLLLALPAGQLWFHIVLEVVSALATYELVRRVTTSVAAGFVGGVVFGLNGTYAWLFHAPGNPGAFAVLLLLGIELCITRTGERRPGGAVLVALATAGSLLSGFPETAYIDGLLAVVWLLGRLPLDVREAGRAVARIGRGGAAGLLLAAPVLVPFASYVAGANLGGHAGAFATGSLAAAFALPPMVLPYVYGPVFGFSAFDRSGAVGVWWGNAGGYLGASATMLAIIGLVSSPRRRLTVVLSAWVVLGLFRLVGAHWALAVVNFVPGVASTAFYRYAGLSWELAVAVLAGLGVAAMQTSGLLRKVAPVAVAVAVAAVSLIELHALSRPVLVKLLAAPSERKWELLSLASSAAVVGVIATIGLCSHRRWMARVLCAVVAAEVVVLYGLPTLSAPRRQVVDLAPVAYLLDHIGTDRVATVGPLFPNYGSYFGLATINVNDLVPARWSAYIATNLDSNVDPNIFTGTTRRDQSGPGVVDELLAHLDGYREVGVRYVVAPPGTTLGSPPVAKVVFTDPTATVLELLTPPAPRFMSPTPGCTVTTMSGDSAVVTCAQPGTVVRHELYDAGWAAYGSGHRLVVRSWAGTFQEVAVGAGTTRLSFSYAPLHIGVAYLAAILGVAVLALPGLRRLARYTRHRRPRSEG